MFYVTSLQRMEESCSDISTPFLSAFFLMRFCFGTLKHLCYPVLPCSTFAELFHHIFTKGNIYITTERWKDYMNVPISLFRATTLLLLKNKQTVLIPDFISYTKSLDNVVAN